MSTFVFKVSRMAVFCPPLSTRDDDTHKKVLFYYPKTDDCNTREIHIGVFETIAYFGRDKAGADVTLIETVNSKICLSEPEQGVYIAISLQKPSEYSPESPLTDVLPGVTEVPEALLKRLTQLLYQLLYQSVGSVKEYVRLFGIVKTRCSIYNTCKLYLNWLQREGIPLRTLLGGLTYTELSADKQKTSKGGDVIKESDYVNHYSLAEIMKQHCPTVEYFFTVTSEGSFDHIHMPPRSVPNMSLWLERCVLCRGGFGTGVKEKLSPVVLEKKTAVLLPRYGKDGERDYEKLWSKLTEEDQRGLTENYAGNADVTSYLEDGSNQLFPVVLSGFGDPNVKKVNLLPLVWLMTDKRDEEDEEEEEEIERDSFISPGREQAEWGELLKEETFNGDDEVELCYDYVRSRLTTRAKSKPSKVYLRPFRLVVVSEFGKPVYNVGFIKAKRSGEFGFSRPTVEEVANIVATFGYVNTYSMCPSGKQDGPIINDKEGVKCSGGNTGKDTRKDTDGVYPLFLAMTGCTMGGVTKRGYEYVTFSPATLSYRATFPDFPPTFYDVLSTKTIRMLRSKVIEEREKDKSFRTNRISLYHALSVMFHCFTLLTGRHDLINICSSCPCGDPTFEGNEAESDRPGQTWLSVHRKSDSTICFTVVDGKCTNIVDAMDKIDVLILTKL